MLELAAQIVAIGEILWDVFPDGERLGGAPFNFAAQAAGLGHRTALLSAVAGDARGRRALAEAQRLAVATELIGTVAEPPTGYVTVSVNVGGQPDYVIHRPAAYDRVELTDEAVKALETNPPEWIYFGTLLQIDPAARATTLRLLNAAPQARRLYDVNLRKDSYSRELLAELLPLATVLKINEGEAAEVRRLFGEPESDIETFVRDYRARYGYEGVCVTLGSAGCYVLWNGREVRAESYPVAVSDAVGAGDAFAAAFVHGVLSRWTTEETADFANRVGALIASRSGAVPGWSVAEAMALERES
ncbi:MAG: PfkB family carbohydrate kinase [Acidobacteria bacterium]|nr:PfkB family carbohydrate kinase [Acidobacteriota bacterium]MDA1235076.1 PfkB family carbohydrate kinase [Acidobacteriota bacterium]